ncbi:MAG: magnesium-translocating P-type ATPase [Candidatus Buchananbacteria bacterium]
MEQSIEKKLEKYSLTSQEAAKRLKKFGENTVYQRQTFRPVIAFAKKFNNPLLMILILTSIVSLLVGEHTNTIILLIMIVTSAILEFVNTYKSQKAVEKLISKVVTTATVVRDGKKKEIPLKDIVPGDLIFLSAGDVVPADCQVLSSKDFFVNQSSLTGESFPAEKKAETSEPKKYQDSDFKPDHESLVFMGTSITTGYGTALVIRTGKSTGYGKIAERLEQQESNTDFEKNIRRFSYFIMQITFFMVLFVFLANAFMGRGWLNSFIFSIAIAIGLTPELLPVIISVSLSHGAVLMAKKDVIVKNLPSIQNFGSMNILCTDKTGTLTQNHIVLTKYVDGFGEVSDQVLLYAYLNSFYHTGIPNPLDDALKEFKKMAINNYQKIDEIPFDFERRRGSIVVQDNSQRILITKGAPEEIFKVCHQYLQQEKKVDFDAKIKKKVKENFARLSRDGFRVLGVAYKDVSQKVEQYEKTEEDKMIFLGFVAFLDPPKETAAKAVQELQNLGIEIKILTGDNELLTEKICREIGLVSAGLLTGSDIDKLSDIELQNLALKTTIFARIEPEQKERIILNLRQAGKVVGYLGDGINDAPALKAADIGISVNNAVDVAKETADIILLKKSLLVLKDGIIEGRKTFQNTMKYIMMGLSSNFGNMLSMMAASAFLPFLPMLPSQILFNNFLYDCSQLSLSTDDVDAEDIKKPTAWSIKFIRKYMFVFGPVSSIFDFLTFALMLFVLRANESQFQTAWFIESLATQALVIYVIRTKKIPFIQSWPGKIVFYNVLAVVALAWAVPFTPLGAILKFSPLPPLVLIIIFIMVIVYLLLVELVKIIFYWCKKNRQMA